MSVTVDNLLFDFDLQEIQVQAARGASLAIQDLINAIRGAEDSEEGIAYDKIADATGKVDKGGGFASDITVNLLDWQVIWYAGTYQAVISGGSLVGGKSSIAVGNTAGVNCIVNNSVNGVLVETGTSGLTPEEASTLSGIKTKTDQITFSKTGEVDANVKSLNDTELLGTGQSGDKWRG